MKPLKQGKYVQRLSQSEKALVNEMVADDKKFYLQESQSPISDGVETVYLLKIHRAWVIRHVTLTDQGELIQWSQSLSRCPYCKGIVEVHEEGPQYCHYCNQEFIS